MKRKGNLFIGLLLSLSLISCEKDILAPTPTPYYSPVRPFNRLEVLRSVSSFQGISFMGKSKYIDWTRVQSSESPYDSITLKLIDSTSTNWEFELTSYMGFGNTHFVTTRFITPKNLTIQESKGVLLTTTSIEGDNKRVTNLVFIPTPTSSYNRVYKFEVRLTQILMDNSSPNSQRTNYKYLHKK